MIKTWRTSNGWHAALETGNVIRRTIRPLESEGLAKAAIVFPTLPEQPTEPERKPWWRFW